MTLFKLLPPLLIAGNLFSAWAAGQVVLSPTIFHVIADEALESKPPLDIAKRGYIAAGTNPNMSPVTFFQGDNRTSAGREIDVVNTVAARLGTEMRWQDIDGFDNIIPGLKLGRYNVVLPNINATKKRLEQVNFVSHYDASRLGVVSRRDANIAPFTFLEAMREQEVGVGAGTTQIGRLEAASKICTDAGESSIKIAVFLNRSSGIQVMVDGHVPIFFGPYEGLAYQVSQIKPLTLTDTIHVDGAPISMAFPKQSGLEEAMQASLNSPAKDGAYQKILDK